MPDMFVSATHSDEAEYAVLGGCLLSSKDLAAVMEIVKPEDFYNTLYGELFGLMAEMYIANKPIDLVTLSDEMKAQDLYERIGGMPFLMQIMTQATKILFPASHAEIVRDYALRRRMITAGENISRIAQKLEYDPSEIIAEAEKEILNASQNMESSSPVSLEELSPSVLRNIDELRSGGNIKGYLSGFKDLDNVLSGFRPGSLNIIAARPSMGKTALALNIAQFGGVRVSNPCVLLFSLEMSAEQLMQRMYAAEAGVSLSSITEGRMSDDDYYSLTEASERLSKRRIFINDSSELSAVDFRTKCRRFKTRHPDLALIVVDYLQLMHTERKRNDNRQQETADISRMLKAVAIELECPVIALSQLSREVERRTEKKPQLSDLRDSGAIEQDADTVILLYREDYYDENKLYNNLDSKAELRVAKNRNGRTGICSLTFQREYTRFVNYAREY